MLTVLKKFFSGPDGTIPGFVNTEELYRAILTSFGSATIIGLIILVLQAIMAHVAMIFPNPAVASLVSMVLTLVLDLLRRQSHGESAVAVVVPPSTIAAEATVDVHSMI